ncbi:GNAT family N-acetyltransferase [Pseudomonas fulva]|uniref:GNAT family N-acetyltransferase n=1 Tax=Pseudomonas TaxID=286 RepID=UPI000FFBED30|nr:MULTISPECIES: GNAT family N-acetyltransferase [Pseudomonas]MBH3365419.1 N-acetyltransferase [Pseudomonas sp. URMO17WK12:I11]MDH1308763.1 GNAT family N-acetyltransferase [Pseudomonas fulva]UNT15740.1 GNAT family N-acetyltransferase [Pseudomonas sp. I3-I5]
MTSLYSLAHLRDMPAATWDALVPEGQPFLSHAFLSAMEDSGSVARTTGWAAEHLVLEHEGKVQALLPGYRKWHSYGEYVFDHGWADACERAGIAYYPKWLGAVPFSPVSGPRLLTADPAAGHLLLQALPEYLSKAALSGAHINFTEPALDVQMARLPGWMERLGCQFHWQNRGYRDFQDFLDTLSSRKRKQMRKEREQVAGQGIDFRWYQGDELDEAQWDFVYLCYANTYAVRGRAPYLTREFFSLLAERMPHALRVVMARQAGRDVAMALSLVGGDSFFGRYWGCLAEFDRLHFETCFYQGMDFAIAHGLQRFDAGAQGEHKLIRGFEPVITRSWHYLLHPGLRTAVADFLLQEREGVMAYAAQAREMLPYRRNEGH